MRTWYFGTGPTPPGAGKIGVCGFQKNRRKGLGKYGWKNYPVLDRWGDGGRSFYK